MTEYPWVCAKCGRLNLVDLVNAESRPVDKLVTAEGFVCAGCGTWNVVFYVTQSLVEALATLERMDVRRKDFRYHFGKVLKKAEGIRAKMER